MRDTGIIRRVDVLGRVVVPKEIRKILKINEGDPLEIYTDKDGVVLKKYSPLSDYAKITDGVIKSLAKMTGKTAAATDKDVVVSFYGKENSPKGQRISAELARIISEKNQRFFFFSEGQEPAPLSASEEKIYRNQFVCPIISDGSAIGAVVISDADKNEKISSTETELARLAAEIIAERL